MQAAALVHIYLDGSVLVSHGGVEYGQGLHTKMIQASFLFLLLPYLPILLHRRSNCCCYFMHSNIFVYCRQLWWFSIPCYMVIGSWSFVKFYNKAWFFHMCNSRYVSMLHDDSYTLFGSLVAKKRLPITEAHMIARMSKTHISCLFRLHRTYNCRLCRRCLLFRNCVILNFCHISTILSEMCFVM